MSEQYRVYVLRNHLGKFYIGLTSQLDRRVEQPWALVWHRGPMTLREAKKMENALKRQRGSVGFYCMTGPPHLPV